MATLKRLNKETGTYEVIPVGGGVPEAPVDDKPYVRKDGEWVNMHDQYENEDIAILIMDTLDSIGAIEKISQEDYDKLSSICPPGKIAFAHWHDDENLDIAPIGLKGMIFKIWNESGEFQIFTNVPYHMYDGHYAYMLQIDTDLTVTAGITFGYIYPEPLDSGETSLVLTEAMSSGNSVESETVTSSIRLLSGGDGTKFLSNSGEYKEIEPGISDAPSDGNLYARKNKAWELLNNSNSEKFPILEEIASVLENESATKDEYDKISSFYDENKISRVDYDDEAYASFWLYGELYVAKINKGDTTFYISASNVRIGTTGINSFGFALYEDLSFSLNYSISHDIGSDDYGLYIQTESSYSGPKELFLQTSGDGTKFLADNGQYVEIDTSNFATKDELEGKQNTISDLDTIRSNAEKGKQALESLPTNLSQLTSDETHRTVTDSEKSTWNSKSDFSGSFSDLTNIPAKITNLRSYTTASTVASLNVNYESIYVTLTANASLSASATGADYNGRTITAYVYTAAAMYITIPTTGDYVSMCGSLFNASAGCWVEFNLTCIDGKWHIAKLEQEEAVSTNPT